MSDPVTAPFAASLRWLRSDRGWSQRNLADRTGVSDATISVIEREVFSPGLRVAILLARAFEVPLEQMVAGDTQRFTCAERPGQENRETP